MEMVIGLERRREEKNNRRRREQSCLLSRDGRHNTVAVATAYQQGRKLGRQE